MRLNEVMNLGPDNAEKSRLGFGAILGRILGYVIAVCLWIAVALVFGGLGGKLGGLQEGGWNWQYLPLIGGAVYGAPVIGTIVAVIRLAQGADYFAALSQAGVGVAVIAFPAAWLLYFLNGMD